MSEAALRNNSPEPPLALMGDPEESTRLAQPSTPVLVERDQSFDGLMSFRGSVRVEGAFQGHLAGNGRVEIGEHARIEGSIEADEVVVGGRFEGEIVARDRLEILATAELRGILTTPQLDAHEGCEVKAHCRTDPSYELGTPASAHNSNSKNDPSKTIDAKKQSPSSS